MDSKTLLLCFILCVRYVQSYSICNIIYSSICGTEECFCGNRQGKKVCKTCDVWCDRTENVECYHGNCKPQGCECEPCYTGDSCLEYNNLYPPEYVHRVFVAKVETFSRGVLRGLAATDLDSSSCAEARASQCYCSRIVHRIVGVSSNQGDFKINHDTGDLSYDVMTEDIIEVNIAAYNYDEYGYPDVQENHIGYAKVKLYVTDKPMSDLETHLVIMENVPNIYNWREEVFDDHKGVENHRHLRHRRQVTAIPANVTAAMVLTSGEIPNVTSPVYFYNFLPVSLTVSIPDGSHSLFVKIYSDLTDANSPTFSFCDPDVTFVGSNFFGWSPTQYTTMLTSPNVLQVNDVLEVDLGIVTNDGSDTTTPEANDIVIEFSAYVMDPADTVFDQPIKIFADIVWDSTTWMLLEKDFLIKSTSTSSVQDPLVTLDGPLSLNPGATGHWTVKTFILHPYADFSLEVVGTISSYIELCSAHYNGHGNAYMCYNGSQTGATPSSSGSGGFSFSLGRVYNTEFNVPDNAEKYFSFLIYGEMPTSAVIGQNYSFTVNVDLSGVSYTFQQNITAFDVAIPQAPGTPTLSLSPVSSTIHQGGKQTINVQVMTLTNQTETYLVTVSDPTPTNEIVHICGAELETVGSNIKCGVNKFNITLISSANNNLNDKAIIDLGIITNVALDLDTINDTVSFSVTLCYVSTGSLNLGDSININGELQHGSIIQSPQSASLTVVAGTQTTTAPVVSLMYGNGYPNILPKGHAVYDISLTLPPNTYYENVTISFIGLSNPTPKTSICSLFASVSGNLTCTKFTSPVYIQNEAYTTFQDSGHVNLGSLDNSGSENVVVLARAVVSLVDKSAVTGDTITTNATVTYNSGSLWQGYITSTVDSVNSYPSLTVQYSLTSPQVLAAANKGGVEFELTAELPVGVVTKLIIQATADHTELSICRVYVKSTGSNVPCVSSASWMSHTKYATGGGNSATSLHLPSVTNSGELPSTSENSITFGIVVLVRDGYDFGNLGSSYFDLTISHTDEWTTGSQAAQVHVNSGDSFTTASPVLQVVYPSGANVLKGSTVPVRAKVFTSPNSVTDYKIDFDVTSTGMYICDVKFLWSGKYICVDNADKTLVEGAVNGTYVSASLQFGNIVNWDLSGSTIAVDDNAFVAEVTLAIASDASVNVGDSLTCSIATTHSSSTTLSDAASLTVVSTPTNVYTNIAVTNDPPNAGLVYASISDYMTWGVNFHLPTTTDRYIMTITMPHSAGEAHLTVINATHVASGKNIGCSQNTTLTTILSSALSTSQMTQMTVDLGVISNTGSEFGFENDSMTQFRFTFQVTDHPGNTHGSVHIFTVSVAGDNGGLATATGNVTIQVSGAEIAQLEFDTWTDVIHHTQRSSGHELTLYGRLNLVNTSSAHASTVVVHYLLPTYTAFVAVNEWTVLQPNAAVTGAGGVDLTYPLIRFTDFPTFSLNISIDPNSEFETGSINIHTVIPAEVTYMSYQRPDRDDFDTHNTLLDIVEFGFGSTVCDKIIGTDTPVLIDSQISASSEQNMAFNIKKSSGSGWKPKKRGKPFCTNEFVTVNFVDRMKIIAFSVLSAGDDNVDYVTSLTLQYSDDGHFWTYVGSNDTDIKWFNVAFDDGTKTVNDAFKFSLNVSEEFTAAYVRIIPKSGNTRTCDPAIRVEFEGCKIGTNTVNSTWTDTPTFSVSDRSLLTDTTTGVMFACVKSGVEGENICSMSTDNGTSWEEVDGVGDIEGVVTNTSTLVGISQDGMVQLCSDDDGVTWTSCQGIDVTEIKSETNYLASKQQPFDDFSASTDDTMFSTYGFSHPEFDVTGTMSGLKVRHLGSGSWTTVSWWGSSDWSLL